MTFDLLAQVESDTGAEYRRVGPDDGGEHAGPCPRCGGADRFHVWPEYVGPNYKAGVKGKFACIDSTAAIPRAGCGLGGDSIQYLRDVHGLGYVRAHRIVTGQDPPLQGTARPAAIASSTRPTAYTVKPSCDLWQGRARAFVDWAEGELWNGDGEALGYLVARRGLRPETIKHFRLGYNPKGLHCPGDKWGRSERVYCPHGIAIPCFAEGALWYVKVRRPAYHKGTTEPDGLGEVLGHVVDFAQDDKYLHVSGGQPCALFGADDLRGDGRPLLVCEGELDCMLAWQELRDLADVCAIKPGGRRGLPANWRLSLQPYSTLLVCYDVDENAAGDRMAGAWLAQSKRARRVRVPGGSDVTDLTDFYLAGGDLRAWLAAHLDAA